MAPAHAQHRLALQTLHTRQATERWILKTPNHLWNLDALLAAYPDARIVWTHRDPGPVITSLASLANAAQRPLTSRTDPKPTAEEWKRTCTFAIGSAMAYDEAHPAGWAQHLHYERLVADPVGTVSALYEQFGQEVSPLHARRMEAWVTDRPADHHGKHVYDPKDFGWTYDALDDGLARTSSDTTSRCRPADRSQRPELPAAGPLLGPGTARSRASTGVAQVSATE
jgi:hypothetical protein